MFGRHRALELKVSAGMVDCPLRERSVELTECLRCSALTAVRKNGEISSITCDRSAALSAYAGAGSTGDVRDDSALSVFLARPC